MTKAKLSPSTDAPADTPRRCPNCLADGLRPFYTVRQIPVHSVLLMPTHDKAIRYPRDDVELGFCPSCGFICNTIFDPQLHEYSPQYEETQHFSGHFNRFAIQLAHDLVSTYDIRDKSVLEIGCGKGEFLALLCDAGDNRGIGIDPACIPDRIAKKTDRPIEFIQDFYSPKFAHLQADVIVCRHTLEHIPETHACLSAIRESIGDRDDVLVVFEVPDTAIVLREQRFWDIYYEHCSYFTAESLGRLFHDCGFAIDRLWREYSDQYLLIAARPSNAALSSDLPADVGSIETVEQLVTDFETQVPEKTDGWRTRVNEFAAQGRRPVIWGAGSKGVAFLTTLGIERQIEYAVDINPHKQGCFLPKTGHPVVGPEFLAEYRPEIVLVMNDVYCAEISETLRGLGVHAELIPV